MTIDLEDNNFESTISSTNTLPDLNDKSKDIEDLLEDETKLFIKKAYEAYKVLWVSLKFFYYFLVSQ